MDKIDYSKWTDEELINGYKDAKEQESLLFTEQLTLKLAINALD